ncbi:MAG: squalene/phytoene synthase family protein [Thermoplasmata archaeon]|nr:squalene/phytoene synthase family protein [Thermoplasmata archaeon]
MKTNNPNNTTDPLKLAVTPSINIEALQNTSQIGETGGNINMTEVKKSVFIPHEYDLLSKLSYQELLTNPILDFAARTWEEDRYKAAQICYSYMRVIDDLIDNRKAGTPSLTEFEQQEFATIVNDCIESINEAKPSALVQKELVETIKKFRIPLWPLQRFSKSMIFDIHNNGFKTFNSFLKYAEGAAIAPASIFVHFCGVKQENGGYRTPDFDIIEVARPAALYCYLVHIIRDFQKDQHNNLNYFAEDLVIENGLDLKMLKEIASGGEITPGFRNLIEKYYNYADYYRLKTRHMIDKIRPRLEPRYQLSFEIIYNLYLQIFERIDVRNGRFTTKELNPTPKEVKNRIDQTINNTIILNYTRF